MPALTQRLGNIGKNPFMWRSFLPSGIVDKADNYLVPAGFVATISNAPKANGNLDIGKVKAFFAGSLLPLEDIKDIRLRATVMGEPIAEKDVKTAFDAYCAQIAAKRIVYHYNAEDSPFDVNFKGNSNCQGRAKGFLQLMAVLGLSKEQLNFCTIGGASGEEDDKLCQKSEDDIVSTNVYKWDGAVRDHPAPNAVRVELKLGKAVVVRTPREPFANHYATCLDVSGLGMKYWDPLEGTAYRNGFADFFTSYSPDESLLGGNMQRWKGLGLKCLANPDNKKERIYLLPPSSKVRGLLGTGAYCLQAAFKEVEVQMGEMLTAEPQVAMIIDGGDWGSDTGVHPPVIRTMFPG